MTAKLVFLPMLLATILPLATAMPALAVELDFSPDCRLYQQIQVVGPNNSIVFNKNIMGDANGTADIQAINNLDTYVIPANVDSCIVAAPHADDQYCFIARSDENITSVTANVGINPGGLPACQ